MSAQRRRCGNQNTITRPSTMRPLATQTTLTPGSLTTFRPVNWLSRRKRNVSPSACTFWLRGRFWIVTVRFVALSYSSRRTVPSGTAVSYAPGSGPTM